MCYSPQGSFFVTASRDGSIKQWDGVSGRCVMTIQRAHDNAEVSSVCLSRNSNYLLSGGRDGTCRLWDLSMGRVLVTYDKAPQSRVRARSRFTHDEQFVASIDETTNAVVLFDARTGAVSTTLVGHTAPPRAVASHPRVPGLMTCGEDKCSRFWSLSP